MYKAGGIGSSSAKRTCLTNFAIAIIVLLSLLVIPQSGTANAATYQVTRFDDIVDTAGCQSGGPCSLRSAILLANVDPELDTVVLAPGTYTLTIAGQGEDDGQLGDLDIKSDLRMIGGGGNIDADPSKTVIKGEGINDRIFDMYSGTTGYQVSFQALTITGGNLANTDGYGMGGGLAAEMKGGSLTIDNCIFTDNQVTEPGAQGGAVFVQDDATRVTITDSVFSNNQATSNGGAVYTMTNSVQISETTFKDNVAGANGGGHFLGSRTQTDNAVLEANTFEGNQAGEAGGGLFIDQIEDATVQNTTISGNQAREGGGLHVRLGTFLGQHLTITDNNATTGAGINLSSTDASLQNSIIAQNHGSEIGGNLNVAASKNNLVGTAGGIGGLTAATGNLLNVADPKLQPLANNGGTTKTHAFSVGSPALDAGDAMITGLPSTDQRGNVRNAYGATVEQTAKPDIGAFEAHPMLSEIPDQNGAGSTLSIPFLVGDDQIGAISLQAVSSNQTLVPNTNLHLKGSGKQRTLEITPTAGQSGTTTIELTASADTAGQSNTIRETFQLTITQGPDLAINKSHLGDFYAGQQGAEYLIEVSNVGTAATDGIVSVVDTLPAGLSFAGVSGQGWTCIGIQPNCTREDSLMPGEKYPPISVRVNVTNTAPLLLVNQAAVSGLLDTNLANNTASDMTMIRPNATALTLTPPADTVYKLGDALTFGVRFSSLVTVTGTPTLPIKLGNQTVSALYQAGTGSDVLTFQYTVKTGDLAPGGITVLGGIDLGTATIKDSASNADAVVNMVQATFAHVKVDAVAPEVTSVQGPNPGIYKAGGTLDFTVNFNENVNLITKGSEPPHLQVMIGTEQKTASYVSGAGTSALAFRYTVALNDFDADGIAVLSMNAGSYELKDQAGNAAALTLRNISNTSAVTVDAKAPQIIRVDVPAADHYRVGDELEFKVAVSEDVNVSVAGGKPTLPIVIGATTRQASFVNSSQPDLLIFRYDVQASDEDLNGITLASDLELNGSVIQNASGQTLFPTLQGAASTEQVRIDNTPPVIKLNGDALVTTYLGSTFQDPGVTITDNLSTQLQATVSGDLDTNKLGTYTVRYNTEDQAGNKAVEVTRTVEVMSRPVPPPPPVTYPVTGVTLNESSLKLKVGDEPVTLRATVKPANATNAAVTWESSDEEVATVSSNGLVTPIGKGKAIITVRTVDGGYTDTATVTVEKAEQEDGALLATERSYLVKPGGSVGFRIYSVDKQGKRTDITKNKETSYEVDQALITVKPGLIRAKKEEGEATLTVRYKEHELDIPITITSNLVKQVVLDQTTVYMLKDEEQLLTLEAVYQDKTKEDVTAKATWATSNRKVVKVNEDGELTAVGTGTATITAIYGGKRDLLRVRVAKEWKVTKLTADVRSLSLIVDDTKAVKLTAQWENGKKETVTSDTDWKSSNPKVAEVDAEGVITAMGPGRTTVKATYKGKTFSFSVTVRAKNN